MRSIVDIMSDFARATANMTDKERNRRVAVAFGARGLLAFNAIQKAAFTTVRDGVTVTLRGAEAIAALRKQMGNAAGSAAQFRDKLLDTFEGQKTQSSHPSQYRVGPCALAVPVSVPDMKTPGPEVLAPADTPDKLKTALHFGADAVYLGLRKFSMRSFAGNFTFDELEWALARRGGDCVSMLEPGRRQYGGRSRRKP